MGNIEPHISVGGSFGLLAVGVLLVMLVFDEVSKWLIRLLNIVALWAAPTVLVFLRKDMGVRTVSIWNIVKATLFLYFVGNVVGHNYHDMYRNANATVWGARVHFTYLVMFIVMAAYRRIVAGLNERTFTPSGWGTASAIAAKLPTYWVRAAPDGVYAQVLREPATVIGLGLLLGWVLDNWFGWYLVLSGCVLLYALLCEYVWSRESRLDALDNPKRAEQ